MPRFWIWMSLIVTRYAPPTQSPSRTFCKTTYLNHTAAVLTAKVEVEFF